LIAIQAADVINAIAAVKEFGSLVLTTLHSEITPILDCAAFLSSPEARFPCRSTSKNTGSFRPFARSVQFYVGAGCRSICAVRVRRRKSHRVCVTIPEPIVIDPKQPDCEARIAALHPGPGIYLLHLAQAAPHLATSFYLRARVRRLLASSDTAGVKQRVRDNLLAIHCWPTASKLESSILLLSLATRWFPGDYARKLRLRAPSFVGLSLSDPFPRLFVSQRIHHGGDPLYGPFPTRDLAQAYADAVSGLFQIRKCADSLLPSPDHPGCIYGEMNQCLRPCQCAVSDQEYNAETTRVRDFLSTNGTAMRSSLLIARERASDEMDFEGAAQIHKRIERLNTAMIARDESVADIRSFTGVALTRSLQPGVLRLWPMVNAVWLDPVDVPVAAEASRSLDAALRERLADALNSVPGKHQDQSSHLAVLLRWHRSSWRDGEWFPSVPGKGISYRKLVREVSKLAKQQETERAS
jgi:excinuclease ABC subunit C